MLFLMSLTAFADGDADEIAALGTQLDAFDANIVAAHEKAWAGGLEAGQADSLRERLEADAVALRPLGRKLTIYEGRLNSDPKFGKKYGADVQALRARVSAQRKERGVALDLLEALVAFGRTQTDPAAWDQVSRELTSLAETPLPSPPDAWLLPMLDRAVEAEQWAFVHGAGTWCSHVCTDTERMQPLLEKVPADLRPDFRWTRVEQALQKP